MTKETIMKYLLLALTLIPSLSFADFTDVNSNHPAFLAVNYLQDQGIVEGYADGTFKPSEGLNRAEFTKIIMESQFENDALNQCRNTGNFNDVNTNAWYRPYVCLAAQKGIIQGYPDGSFKAGNPVLFGEAAKIIVESFNLNTDKNLTPWYAPYVKRLQDDRAVPSSIKGAEQALNRGEMAELIYQLIINTASTPEPEIVTKRGTESVGASDFDDNQIQTILELTNQARAENNAPVLTLNTTLNQVAQDYAERMDKEDFFDHVDPEGKGPGKRVTEAGYKWRYIGENIAKGQVSAQYAFDNWKESSGHWANILNPNYKEIGIGQFKVTNDNRFRGYFWVQVFATQP